MKCEINKKFIFDKNEITILYDLFSKLSDYDFANLGYDDKEIKAFHNWSSWLESHLYDKIKEKV